MGQKKLHSESAGRNTSGKKGHLEDRRNERITLRRILERCVVRIGGG
jgi:hypothetical protein